MLAAGIEDSTAPDKSPKRCRICKEEVDPKGRRGKVITCGKDRCVRENRSQKDKEYKSNHEDPKSRGPLRISAPGNPSIAIYRKTGERCEILDHAAAAGHYFCHLFGAGVQVWIPRALLEAVPEEPAAAPPPIDSNALLSPRDREQIIRSVEDTPKKAVRPVRVYMAVGID